MYKILAFLTKRADMSTDDFIDYYENHHVPLVVSLSGDTLPILYKRRYTRRGSGNEIRTAVVGPQIDFDVVTEMGFVDRAAYEAWWKEMTSEGVREKLVEDEGRFSDEGRTRIVVVEEFVTSG